MSRLFENPKGDWSKLDKKLEEIHMYAEAVDQLARDLMEADRRLRTMILDAYKLTPKVDALFYDSPISPTRQTLNLKMYLKRLGWEGVRDVYLDKDKIPEFSKVTKDAVAWLSKFKTQEPSIKMDKTHGGRK